MREMLDDLLWARYCVLEIVGAAVVGTVLGYGLQQFGGAGALVSHLVATLLGVVVFSLLVGERLTRTPE